MEAATKPLCNPSSSPSPKNTENPKAELDYIDSSLSPQKKKISQNSPKKGKSEKKENLSDTKKTKTSSAIKSSFVNEENKYPIKSKIFEDFENKKRKQRHIPKQNETQSTNKKIVSKKTENKSQSPNKNQQHNRENQTKGIQSPNTTEPLQKIKKIISAAANYFGEPINGIDDLLHMFENIQSDELTNDSENCHYLKLKGKKYRKKIKNLVNQLRESQQTNNRFIDTSQQMIENYENKIRDVNNEKNGIIKEQINTIENLHKSIENLRNDQNQNSHIEKSKNHIEQKCEDKEDDGNKDHDLSQDETELEKTEISAKDFDLEVEEKKKKESEVVKISQSPSKKCKQNESKLSLKSSLKSDQEGVEDNSDHKVKNVKIDDNITKTDQKNECEEKSVSSNDDINAAAVFEDINKEIGSSSTSSTIIDKDTLKINKIEAEEFNKTVKENEINNQEKAKFLTKFVANELEFFEIFHYDQNNKALNLENEQEEIENRLKNAENQLKTKNGEYDLLQLKNHSIKLLYNEALKEAETLRSALMDTSKNGELEEESNDHPELYNKILDENFSLKQKNSLLEIQNYNYEEEKAVLLRKIDTLGKTVQQMNDQLDSSNNESRIIHEKLLDKKNYIHSGDSNSKNIPSKVFECKRINEKYPKLSKMIRQIAENSSLSTTIKIQSILNEISLFFEVIINGTDNQNSINNDNILEYKDLKKDDKTKKSFEKDQNNAVILNESTKDNNCNREKYSSENDHEINRNISLDNQSNLNDEFQTIKEKNAELGILLKETAQKLIIANRKIVELKESEIKRKNIEKKKLDRVKKDLNEKKKRNKELKKVANDKDIIIHKKENEIQYLVNFNKEMEIKCQYLKSEIKTGNLRIIELNDEVKSSCNKNFLSNYEDDEKKTLKLKIIELESELKEKIQQNEHQNGQSLHEQTSLTISNLRRNVAELEKENEEIINQNQTRINSLQNQTHCYKNEIEDLKNYINQKDAEKQQLLNSNKNISNEFQKQCEHYRNDLEKVAVDLSNEKQKRKKLAQKILGCKLENKKLENDKNILLEQMEIIKSQNVEIRNNSEKQTLENEGIKNDLQKEIEQKLTKWYKYVCDLFENNSNSNVNEMKTKFLLENVSCELRYFRESDRNIRQIADIPESLTTEDGIALLVFQK